MTRKFTSWQGADLSPEYDFTDPLSDVNVIWEEVEVGGRAWRGESDVGTVPIRDERGQTGNEANLPSGLALVSLAAHNRWRWSEQNGSNTMARGWIGPKDYMRDLEGGLRADRYREVRMSVLDANEQLKGVIVDENRPSETDVAFVQWVLSTYLSGSPDPTRVIADTYVAAGSNTVTLPARRVVGDPRSVLAEAAAFANKEVFVTVDEELFYDGWDSTAYAAGLRISDRIDEITTASSQAGPSSVRLYPSVNIVGNSAEPEADAAPALDHANADAAWDTAANLGYYYMYDAAQSTTSTANAGWTGINAAAQDVGLAGFVHILTGDLLSIVQNGGVAAGQFRTDARFGIGVDEGAQGHYAKWCGRVYRPGVGFVATLWTVDSFTGTSNFPAQATEVNKTWSATIAAYASAQSGDYLVVDVGAQHRTPTSGATGAGVYWNDTAGSDLPIDDSTTDNLRAWIQLGPAEEALPTYPPIFDLGPAATEDGQQLLSGLRMYYGQGSNTYVYVNHPVTANSYAHYEEAMYAPEWITTASAATTFAQSVLQRRRYEDRNINVSVGPLPIEHAILVKYGQLIDIKARAIAFADDQYFTGRIRQLRWTTPVPGMFFAHMQIERPVKDVPYGIGNRAGSEAINAHVQQGSNAHPEFVQRGILTAQGDLPYRGASDWTRLSIGASNTHLVSDGTVPRWISNAGAGHTSHTAADVSITDAGGYFTATDVEGALQELGAASGTGGLTDLLRAHAHGLFLAACHESGVDTPHIIGSLDGKTFEDVSGAITTDNVSPTYAGDPTLLHWNGYYWLLHQYSTAHGQAAFTVLRSEDPSSNLWTEVAEVQPGVPGEVSVYPGAWARNEDGTPYLDPTDGRPRLFLTVSTTLPVNDGPFAPYELHPTNDAMTSWSTAVEIAGDFPADIIDPFVIKHGDEWAFWYKSNDPGDEVIEYATCATLTGTYTVQQTGDWAGWGTQRENPSLVKLDDGTWRIYIQKYTNLGTWWSESTDDWATWSAETQVVSPFADDNDLYGFDPIFIPGVLDHMRDPNAHADVLTSVTPAYRWVPVSIDPAGDGSWEILFDDDGSVVMMEVYD